MREGYSPMAECRNHCKTETGDRNQVCINQCLAHRTGLNLQTKCTSNQDCPKRDVCVLGGAYNSPNEGICMTPREPYNGRALLRSIGQDISKGRRMVESYGPNIHMRTCPPLHYFDQWIGQCQPVFQGIPRPTPQPRPSISIPTGAQQWQGSSSYGISLADPFERPTHTTIY